MMVAACFWEEHCTECGEPECYRSCAKYVRGIGGRCRRFEGGLKETILCEGVEATFLPWGKMEACFHGRMVPVGRARRLERLMARTARLRTACPRLWRSARWRWAILRAESGSPDVWRVRAVSERDERLALQVVDRELKGVTGGVLDLKAGVESEIALALPPVGDGALFRIFPQDGGGTGKVRFLFNRIVKDGGANVKCVAWDLDGTLWKGTLADDGVEGLALDERAVRLVKELDARGIVNSVVSRNDPETALDALRKFGIEEYFVFPQIGWGPKSASVRKLAKDLNIALDAIVFIDDREEVRNEVRANAPGVRVEDRLEGLEGLEGSEGLGCERRKMYRAEMARRAEMAKAFEGDAAAFLAASGLREELVPVAGEVAVRCRELVQRTNQLNLTGRRYDEAAFAGLLASAACHAVHVWDKYGDYGIVGFLALRGTHVVECCFSCRIAEKGVERRVLEKIAAGRKLTADIVVTERNEKIRRIVEEMVRVER